MAASRFCTACGAWLQAAADEAHEGAAPAPAGSSETCTRCHHLAVPGGNFCAHCGLRRNQAPLTRAEEKTRRWRAEEAARPHRSPAERDRSTVRGGWTAIAVCGLLLAADVALLVSDPAHATFLGPLAVLLVLHAPVWLSGFNDARGRQRRRRQTPTPPEGPPSDVRPPRSPAPSGGR